MGERSETVRGNERTIKAAAFKANLEILKYCFSNSCPCEEKEACTAAAGGHLDCLRFLVDKVKPSRGTECKRQEKQHAVVTWRS